MEIFVLDRNLDTIHLIDGYKSLIWTDRYNSPGDFELFTEVSGEVLKYVKKEVYLSIKESDRLMVVTDIEIDSDRDLGNLIRITGSSMESVIGRRIIWGLVTLNTNLESAIQKIISENVTTSDQYRKIPNIVFLSSKDPRITGIKLDTQYTGDNVLEVIEELCKEYDVGFKMVLNERNQFIFSLYAGVDRSYDQTENPYVIFSPSFENLVNSNYFDSDSNLKTMALIGGEGEGYARYYTTYIVSNKKGLDRRELFVDARDLQRKYYDDDGTEHIRPISEYDALLKARGKTKLAEYQSETLFEGEVEPYNSFVYKRDYNLGDIVQIENEYGFKGTARITEVVTCHDENGYSVYPTFKMLDDEG